MLYVYIRLGIPLPWLMKEKKNFLNFWEKKAKWGNKCWQHIKKKVRSGTVRLKKSCNVEKTFGGTCHN